jgi:hypothetical protein
MPNKKQRMQNADNHRRLMLATRHKRQCPNCREWHRGEGHYAPPSFGEEGFFICAKVDER